MQRLAAFYAATVAARSAEANAQLDAALAADPEYLDACDAARWAAWEAQDAANDRAQRSGVWRVA